MPKKVEYSDGDYHCYHCNEIWSEEAMGIVSDWGGDPTIPNGTFDASYLVCPGCSKEEVITS